LATVSGKSVLEYDELLNVLSDPESAGFKDIESDTLSKVDNGLGNVAGIQFDFVDFDGNSSSIIPHMRITVPQSRDSAALQSRLREELTFIEMNNEIEMIPESVIIGNDIRRKFLARVRFKDAEITDPIRYTPEDYQTVVGKVIRSELELRDENVTVSDLAQYAKTEEGFKELWYEIEFGAGVPEDPFVLQKYLREKSGSFIAEVSVNDFIVELINVYPSGYLDLLELNKDEETVAPDPVSNELTGTVVISGLSPEVINKLYKGFDPTKVNPDANRISNEIEGLFTPLVIGDIEKLRIDYFEPIDDSTALGKSTFQYRKM
jgi:hypothetical protein